MCHGIPPSRLARLLLGAKLRRIRTPWAIVTVTATAVVITTAVVMGLIMLPNTSEERDSSGLPDSGFQEISGPSVSKKILSGHASWRRALSRADRPKAMSAFADKPAALPGDPVALHVSTTAKSYRVIAYRMGYYGGSEARKIWRSKPLLGKKQRAVGFDQDLRMPYAKWKPSIKLRTKKWPAGPYLLRLVGSNGAQWLVPLVLREERVAGKLVVVIPDTTFQAYNDWGGLSAYTGKTGDRSRAVSYARPYKKAAGTGGYLTLAQPVVKFAEKWGLPVTYVAASDLDTGTATMVNAQGVATLGHDEYWTPERRERTEAARDSGTDLAFLGANAVYWRIRIESGPSNMRKMVIYRDSEEDPVSGKRTTVRFRDEPAAAPERSLIGIQYGCLKAEGQFVVTDPDFFLYRGTGVKRGDRFPGVVLGEVDWAESRPSTPRNLQIVAENPTTCEGVPAVGHTSYYSTESGAGVFATGSIGWIRNALSGLPRRSLTTPQRSAKFVRKVTRNLLTEMAAGPMGENFPAKGNINEFDLSGNDGRK